STELARNGLSSVIDRRPLGAQDEPRLDVDPEVAPTTRDVVRVAPRDIFETDVLPARCDGAVAGPTRITLRLAAGLPGFRAEDGSKKRPRVNLSGEGLVARLDPDRLGADGHNPPQGGGGAEGRVGGKGRRVWPR